MEQEKLTEEINLELVSDDPAIVEGEGYVTKAEAARMLSVSRQRVHQYINNANDGRLRIVVIRGKERIPIEDVKNFQRRDNLRGARGKGKQKNTVSLGKENGQL